MAKNRNLLEAKRNKNDEFYTQLVDIENELKHYTKHFENKVVYCNCDDPYESNFFKYFCMNFNKLKLKKLIATGFIASVNNTGFDISNNDNNNDRNTVSVTIIEEIKDENNDGCVDLKDVKILLNKETRKPLTGDIDKETNKVIYAPGDFRSKECIELLKEADVVVTNPPFSLFREYITKLEENKKKYLLLGNQNVITYKEIFPLIKENKLWLGPSITSGDREYKVPDDYVISTKNFRIDENGGKFIRVPGVRWFTNLDHNKRHEELILYEKYDKDKYPKYDNYDAINVDKTKEIPEDYEGYMGVPITFLDKYNPEQFEIIKFRKGNDDKDLAINGKCPYFRILIKNKNPKIKKENE